MIDKFQHPLNGESNQRILERIIYHLDLLTTEVNRQAEQIKLLRSRTGGAGR